MSGIPSSNLIPRAERKTFGWKAATSLAVVLSITLGACATDSAPKTTGERLSDRGSEIGSYGTSWSEGRKSVEMAEEAIEKSNRNQADAERDLARAQEKLAKAEQQISDASAAKTAALQRIEDGRAQMARAEADYATTKAGPSAVHPEY